MNSRHALAAGVAILLAACGGDDGPTAPSFPAVAGTYQLTGSFDGFTTTQAYVSGAITLTQPDRSTGLLNVLGSLTARAGTTIVTVSQFGSATVDNGGRVIFQVAGLSTTESWIFDGNLSSDGLHIGGRHTLTSSSGSSSGNFTASRQ
jgi:hypothetical protein